MCVRVAVWLVGKTISVMVLRIFSWPESHSDYVGLTNEDGSDLKTNKMIG